MIELTAIGMGLIMTSLAVVLGGLLLEATLLMMGRALQDGQSTSRPSAGVSVGWPKESE